MPAKDRYHNAVIRALIKDGWTILGEPIDQTVIRDVGVRLAIFEPDNEEIIRWIP